MPSRSGAEPGADIVLAFDFGLRRIGIATANRKTNTASPLTTLHIGQKLPWHDVDAVIEEWRPGQLVVGVPDPSSAGEIAARAAGFAAALASRYELPVAAVDESLTSRAASSELVAAKRAGASRKRIGRDRIDRHAACLIAEQWMREQPNDRRPNQ